MVNKPWIAALAGPARRFSAAALPLLLLAVVSNAVAQSAAPMNLTAAASPGGITLSWTPPNAAGVTGYQIMRRLSADGWVWSQAVYVDDTGSLATTYNDTNVEAGEAYHYRVKAWYGAVLGRWSNGVAVRAAAADPEPSLSDDATLSRLELSGVSFAFDPATYSYDVSVGHDVEQTTITAGTNHAGASYDVAIVWARAYEDGLITLNVGANVIVLAVTAQDDETVQSYTVNVTRAEEPEALLPRSIQFVPEPQAEGPRTARQTACDAVWCATLTVDKQGDTFGWASGPELAGAALSDANFNFGGEEYQLNEITWDSMENTLRLSFANFKAGDIDNQNTRSGLALEIDGTTFNLGDGTFDSSDKSIEWTHNVAWTDGQIVSLKIVNRTTLSIRAKASPIKEERNAKATFILTRSGLTFGWTTANLGWSRTGNYLRCNPTCIPTHDGVEAGQLHLSPVFAPGETTKTLTVNIDDDNDYELPGSVTMFIREPGIPGNEYDIDPDGQTATVEVHSHGRSGGPLGFFGDRFPPILIALDSPPAVAEEKGEYTFGVRLRVVPFSTSGITTWATDLISEDMGIPETFSVTVSTRGGTAIPNDDYNAVSHGVLFESQRCNPPPALVNNCWRWDGQTWVNNQAVVVNPDVTPGVTGKPPGPGLVADSEWENHEYLDLVIERSPGLYGAVRFDLNVERTQRMWIMDTGPAGDPGLTADWTPGGVKLDWSRGHTVVPKIARATGPEWQYTVWRRNLSDSQSAPYEDVAGSHDFRSTTDQTVEVDGRDKLNLVEYVVDGVAYRGGTMVERWTSPKRLFRPHAVVDGNNPDVASRDGVVAPGHPSGLELDQNMADNIILTWAAPEHGPVTSYKVCRNQIRNDPDGPRDGCEHTFDVPGDETTLIYTDNSAVAYDVYEYRVMAVNASRGHSVEGGSSNAVRFFRRNNSVEPRSPGNVTFTWTRDPDYSVTLRWGNPRDATSFIVRRWLYSETDGPIRPAKVYTVEGPRPPPPGPTPRT